MCGCGARAVARGYVWGEPLRLLRILVERLGESLWCLLTVVSPRVPPSGSRWHARVGKSDGAPLASPDPAPRTSAGREQEHGREAHRQYQATGRQAVSLSLTRSLDDDVNSLIATPRPKLVTTALKARKSEVAPALITLTSSTPNPRSHCTDSIADPALSDVGSNAMRKVAAFFHGLATHTIPP